MTSLLDADLERYVVAHTTPEDELFVRLRRETEAGLDDPEMQVGAVEGRFLRLLVSSRMRAVETATSTTSSVGT